MARSGKVLGKTAILSAIALLIIGACVRVADPNTAKTGIKKAKAARKADAETAAPAVSDANNTTPALTSLLTMGTVADALMRPKTPCALFCHLPPPWQQWWPGLNDKCDVETSLFVHTNKSPLEQLDDIRLSALDLVQCRLSIQQAMWTNSSERQTDKDLTAADKVLKHDIDTVQGVLFGRVLDWEKTVRQNQVARNGKLVLFTNSWKPKGGQNKALCIAITALGEVKRLLESRFTELQFSEYKEKRRLCLDHGGGSVQGVTWNMEEVKVAVAAIEGVLPRTELIASYGGKEKLLEELEQRLPASAPCEGTREECLALRFVSITEWTPPTDLQHQYGNVVFMGCNHTVMTEKAVKTAMRLVAPGGHIIIVMPFSPKLLERNGSNPFDLLLKEGWMQSESLRDVSFGHAIVTVFTPHLVDQDKKESKGDLLTHHGEDMEANQQQEEGQLKETITDETAPASKKHRKRKHRKALPMKQDSSAIRGRLLLVALLATVAITL